MLCDVNRIDRCPACGSTRVEPVVEMNADSAQRFLEFSKIKYDGLMDSWLNRMSVAIDRCPECGHHWYRDQPALEALSEMYSRGRSLLPSVGGPSRSPTTFMLIEMRRLKKITSRGRRLLDYGSGFGRWARAGVIEGFDVTGYEPSSSRGSEPGNLEFELVHDLERLSGCCFDAVNLEQVLEHVPDPLEEMRRIRRMCMAHSVVRVTVPNIKRSEEGERLWPTWPYDGTRVHTMAPFEHLHGFTPLSLRTLCRRAGFLVVPGWRFIYAFPSRGARAVLRRWIPSVDQTFVILVPAQSDN